ncbi:MAG: heat-inducible transcriptional repressor HrcA [Alphaproteobacteria bacterium]|nr:heat-inducible transcriptional repressor HrcA [Alphaproteobacteria bacterium]
MITELNERSRQIFRFIVDSYLETGQPVGSGTISRAAGLHLSPASIRNTMADLESLGLLYAPHTSAGRLPTEHGLRLYVDGFMQISALCEQDRSAIESAARNSGRPVQEMLEQTGTLLSGLSACASLVIAPKTDTALKQIQFVPLDRGKILVVMVMQNGLVENRIMDVPEDIPMTSLTAAANYLNAKIAGKTLTAARKDIAQDIAEHKTKLDTITTDLIARGIALPGHTPANTSEGHIIIRGQSRLLEDVRAIEELERARLLLGYLEEQNNMLSLLERLGEAQGVQIFIGAQNKIFDQSGWSMIVSPYRGTDEKIVGAIGVIGPMRLNYDRIVPMVDYTSRIIERILGGH